MDPFEQYELIFVVAVPFAVALLLLVPVCCYTCYNERKQKLE
jgi:hypothetical protein